MTGAALALRYALFAAVATAANLAAQHLSLGVFDRAPVALPTAMAVGTLVGLVVKYLLDKRWIFFDRSTGMAMHSRKFLLYSTMGLFTTAIFWGTELSFEAWFGTPQMRDFGAILGLAVGYAAKYRLDRRFVFERGIP